MLRTTNGLAPKVLFTDADAGMIAAVHETLPSTKHNYCIWHIRKNLEKNLKGKLCSKYSDFVKEWNKCRNSFSETEFKNRWHNLLTNYPEAKKYLGRTLGIDVTSWALCYTHRSFNGGTQSTQRAESYNSLIKRSVKISTTLYELDTQIQLQLDREEKFEVAGIADGDCGRLDRHLLVGDGAGADDHGIGRQIKLEAVGAELGASR